MLMLNINISIIREKGLRSLKIVFAMYTLTVHCLHGSISSRRATLATSLNCTNLPLPVFFAYTDEVLAPSLSNCLNMSFYSWVEVLYCVICRWILVRNQMFSILKCLRYEKIVPPCRRSRFSTTSSIISPIVLWNRST